MEQFSRDAQPILNKYLTDQIGEQTLIQQAKAWPNYESDYRPLVEIAKTNRLDVIAANAPKPIVQCIAKEGLDYLGRLEPDQRQYVAKNLDTRDSEYKQKFMASMHHGQPNKHENLYASQLTWDATMAESIVDYISQHPDTKIVHIAGKFHTENGLGIATQIKQLNSSLKVIIITPVFELIPNGNDYLLQVTTLPKRYVQQSNQFAAYKELSKRKKRYECN